MLKTTMIALAFAVVLCWFGPALDDHSAEVDQARDIEDAQRAAEVRKRFEDAAQHLCGPQSAWREVSHNVIECTARRGLRAVRLSVTKE